MAKKKFVLLYNEILRYFITHKNQNSAVTNIQKYAQGAVQTCEFSIGSQKYNCEILDEGNLSFYFTMNNTLNMNMDTTIYFTEHFLYFCIVGDFYRLFNFSQKARRI